jgi:cytoskeleton protein RodZ
MSEVAETRTVVGVEVGPAPGGRLAEARQAQNLAPADIARQLKLSLWQVEALEAGRYQQLPGPIFVRGFIRNYARLVKLDPDELLRAAGDSLPQSSPRSEMPPSQDIPFPAERRPRWPILAFAAAILVGVLAVYEFYWNEPEAAATRVVAVTSGSPQIATRSVQVAAASAKPSTRTEGEVTAATPGVTASTAAAQSVAAMPPAAAADTVRFLKRGERRVRLAFEQESWVEIRDRDERVIFSQLNSPGTQQLVQGVPPFSIVVGNAHGVRMTYNDKLVDLMPYTKIDVARLILE